MKKWLSYYHPSTVIFVDDQQAFLTAIKNRLPRQLLTLFFNNPEEALGKIAGGSLSQYQKISPIYNIEEDMEADHTNNNEALFNLKLGELSKNIYNHNRFSEMSVVVVDRMMPELDGITFCRRLIKHPIKKIMLTASKDQKVAIDAFNEGIIDFFILKDSPNLIVELTAAIEKMQWEYFLSVTKRTLGTDLEIIVPIIKNDFMVSFLQSKMHELNAVEFYLLDKWGSILFIKHDGTPITLVISPAELFDTYATIAQEHEQIAISKSLSKREKLLFFPNEIDCMRPVTEWNEYLFEANLLPGTNLFYSIIKNVFYQPISIEKINSQEKYMSKLI